MSHLLNICVPTYNRSRELQALHKSFLSPVLQAHAEDVQIHVFDNSDDPHAHQNSLIEQAGLIYHRNKSNVGFSGNIINCLNAPGAAYVWIISDNDTPLLESFPRLLAAIRRAEQQNMDALFLPFRSINNGLDSGIRNSHRSLNLPSQGSFSVYTHSLEFMPFILFSAAILRVEQKNIADITKKIGEEFMGNDYIQIPLYWSVIGQKGLYEFFQEPALDYQEEFQSRFNFARLVDALERVIEWAPLPAAHRQRLKCAHLRVWCIWLLKHRAGKVRILNPLALYLRILANPNSYREVKNIAGLLLPLMPSGVTSRLLKLH